MTFDIQKEREKLRASDPFERDLIEQWKLLWNQLEWEKLQADLREKLGDPRKVSVEFNEGMRAGIKFAEVVYIYLKSNPGRKSE